MSESLKNESSSGTPHVEELLSGFVDNELTQQDQQRVQVHVESCAECRRQLDDILMMREKIGVASLSKLTQHEWRETMDDLTVKASRGIGWLLLIGGALIAGGVLLFNILIDFGSLDLFEKVVVGGIYGGLLLIFISVLRQRLIERKNDRYKDVEI